MRSFLLSGVARCAVLVGLVLLAEASLAQVTVKIDSRPVRAATHAIVLPDEPTPSERTAADELREYLQAITGEVLTIVAEADFDAARHTPLLVGRCTATAKLAPDIDFAALGKEGLCVRSVDGALVLAGNQRGVLYAVYEFLEGELGVRWLTPDCRVLPTAGPIDIAGLDHSYQPPLEFRDTNYPFNPTPAFYARARFNGGNCTVGAAYGGSEVYGGFVHTFHWFIAPDEFFDEHPEYFSLVDGQRSGHAQLCLTHPEVATVMTEKVRALVRGNPLITIVSISQNDTGGACECEGCSALAAEEGSQAGPLLHFVNTVADNLREEFPDLLIDTLAYQYTRKPPAHVRPRENVIIRLCSIECVFNDTLADHQFNEAFRRDLAGWRDIADRLYIWNYNINVYGTMLPLTNLYVLKPNVNYYLDHHVRGIFEQTNYFTTGGELGELRGYVISKLLWNPDYDVDRAIDEFCAGYYGQAGRYVRQYVDLMQRSNNETHDYVQRVHGQQWDLAIATPAVLAEAEALFDRAARAVADDAVLARRVRIARLPVIYMRLQAANSAPYRLDGDVLRRTVSPDIETLRERFVTGYREAGARSLREVKYAHYEPLVTVDDWLAHVLRYPNETPVMTLRTERMRVQIVPAMGGRIWRMQALDGDGSHDLLRVFGGEGAFVAQRGGYETYSLTGWRSPGWSEAYEVVEAAANRVTLQAKLANGLTLRRQIVLAEDAPRVTLRETLTNHSDQPRPTALRMHPEMPMPIASRSRIAARQADGSWRLVSIETPDDPRRGSAPSWHTELWFSDDALPAGAWALVDLDAGRAIVHRFNPADVDRCYVNVSQVESRANLEVMMRSRQLQPGESVTIEHSYESASLADVGAGGG